MALVTAGSARTGHLTGNGRLRCSGTNDESLRILKFAGLDFAV